MLIEEAVWVGNELEKLIHSGTIKTILNIGSSTAESWNDIQKHVQEFVYAPLEKSDIKLIHTDIKQGDGVDIAGDLNDEVFIKKLKEKNIDLVICANLLEHIDYPSKIATHLTQLLKIGSYAIVTVPRIYPYHPDPEDFLFRPDINTLKALFCELDLVSSSVVEGRRALVKNGRMKYCSNYINVLMNDPRLLILTFLRLLLPFYKFRNWKKTAYYLPYFFKSFSATCIVFVKNQKL